MRFYWYTVPLLALFGPSTASAQKPHGEEAAGKMGPVAFMWPPDREWKADQDNTAPCGSSAGVNKRTSFPTGKSTFSYALCVAFIWCRTFFFFFFSSVLTLSQSSVHGAVALIIQDESWDVQLGISYKNGKSSHII